MSEASPEWQGSDDGQTWITCDPLTADKCSHRYHRLFVHSAWWTSKVALLSTAPAPQPPADAATASDEAVVREIAEELGWSSFGVLDGDSPVMRLALRAFAAGRAAGAREERGECYSDVCDLVCTEHGDEGSGCSCLGQAEQAIARRGGE